MIIRTNQNQSAVPLDRLKALLEGCLPRIEATDPHPIVNGMDAPPDLCILLYPVADGGSVDLPDGLQLAAPFIMVGSPERMPIVHTPPDQTRTCLHVFLDGPVAPFLKQAMHAPIGFSIAGEEGSILAGIAGLIAIEQSMPRCGHAILVQRAGEILFIGILRRLIESPSERASLFRGLADPRIARTIVAMHARPDSPWTLERLSDEAGMSRTAFAGKFKELLGQAPGQYLTTLRLKLAERAIGMGKSLKETARMVGYGSASALSHALARQA